MPYNFPAGQINYPKKYLWILPNREIEQKIHCLFMKIYLDNATPLTEENGRRCQFSKQRKCMVVPLLPFIEMEKIATFLLNLMMKFEQLKHKLNFTQNGAYITEYSVFKFKLEMIHFNGDIFEKSVPQLLLPNCLQQNS